MSGILLQGRHGVGKSTLLHNVLASAQLQGSGYYVQRVLQDNRTRGFCCCRLTQPVQLTARYDPSMDRQMFIDCEHERHQIYMERLVHMAIAELSDPTPRLIVLDELGGVELLDDTLFELLTLRMGSCTLVGSYKSDCNATLLQRQTNIDGGRLAQRRQQLLQIMKAHDIRLLELTQQNIDEVLAELLGFLKGVQ